MQNRYVGDLGDFGKYHLLKILSLGNGCDNGENFALGVVWYLVPNESHNDDGKHIRYLEKSSSNSIRFRNGDPVLYDLLEEIVRDKKRDVTSIQEKCVLPNNTVFYDEPLTFEGLPNNSSVARSRRITHRDKWMKNALVCTAGCDLIFVDPDNGLEVPTVERHHKTGNKHTYFDELEPYISRGQSLVIYHHICRHSKTLEQVKERLSQIKKQLNVNDTYALLYHRGTSRAFFVVPSKEHKNLLFQRGINLVGEAPWNKHFTLVSLQEGQDGEI